jgi:transcriptional regulator with XRE-family HTH domain
MVVSTRDFATMSIRHEPFFKEMGSRIAAARKARGMTQVQLAERLGVSQQTLAHYEVGRVGVGAPMLPMLAEILDLSFDEILVGQVAPYRPGKRGPPSHLAQHLERIAQLPKAKQRLVVEMIDSVIVKAQLEAQHAA